MRPAFFRNLLVWHGSHARHFPWREANCTAWEILLAEMLLRRTGASKVQDVFGKVVGIARTPAELAAVDSEVLCGILQPLGLQRQRAHALQNLAVQIESRTNHEVPADIRELLAMPHIGNYIAGAVAIFYFGKRAALSDVNVTRVGSRYYGLPSGSKRLEKIIARKVLAACPRGGEKAFYYALLDFSAAVCTPRPHCVHCPLRRGCRYPDKTRE